MEIQSLDHTTLNQIVECLVESFAAYFVPMPSDRNYWEKRFEAARVDYSMSYGMFEDDSLTGFIINGIDFAADKYTAFNTGTGVLPAYRGKRVVDRIYEHTIPLLRDHGIQKCSLEVIHQNERAIRVYERIGFSKTRSLKCFKGFLNMETSPAALTETAFQTIIGKQTVNQDLYSWDNNNKAIIAAGEQYESFDVTSKTGGQVGYFVINPVTGYLPQFELYEPATSENWQKLFAGIKQISQQVKINNVDASRNELCTQLLIAGLDNHIDQYEMELPI